MPVFDVATGVASDVPNASSTSVEGSSSASGQQSSISLDTEGTTDWSMRIHDLREDQRKLRFERSRIAKELKAACRKNKRLKERARHLSEDDMMQILLMKQRKPSEPASASSSGTSSSAGSSSSSTGPIEPPRPGEDSRRADREASTPSPSRDAGSAGD